MAQVNNKDIAFLVTVELSKLDKLDNCIDFLSAVKILCCTYHVDIRQPATGAILSTEDKEGKTEY